MRIRYTKPGGKEVELPDGAAQRLIAAGQAEPVEGEDRPDEAQGETGDAPTPRKTVAKTPRRSR